MSSRAMDADLQSTTEQLRDAFRDLHGSRLHGFALLVTLGDAEHAERAAGKALALGEARAASLRHPERAAAWLRAHVVPALRRSRLPGPVDLTVRWTALRNLGIEGSAFDGLAALDFEARVAFVASSIERFAPLDVETILAKGPVATRRAIQRARQRYLSVVASSPAGGQPVPDGAAHREGELGRRIRTVAERALGAASSADFA